jgi:hypothetical protein
MYCIVEATSNEAADQKMNESSGDAKINQSNEQRHSDRALSRRSTGMMT